MLILVNEVSIVSKEFPGSKVSRCLLVVRCSHREEGEVGGESEGFYDKLEDEKELEEEERKNEKEEGDGVDEGDWGGGGCTD